MDMRRLIGTVACLILFACLSTALPARSAEVLSCSVSFDKVEYQAGENITALIHVSGGTPPYRLTAVYWHIAEQDGNSYIYEGEVSGLTSTLRLVNGTHGYCSVVVHDVAGGEAGTYSTHFIIRGSEFHPLTCDINLSALAVAAGNGISANWRILDGVPPYEFTWQWQIQEANGRFEGYAGSYTREDSLGQITFTPPIGETGRLLLTIKDKLLHTLEFVSETFSITGSPPPADYLACNVDISPSRVLIGQPVTATWTAEFGTPPYSASHHWSIAYQGEGDYNEPSASSGASTASYVPSRPCSGVIVLTITDSYGRQVTVRSLSFEASEKLPPPTPEPLTVSLSLSADPIQAGDSLTATVKAEGGMPPYVYTYNWLVYEEGKPAEDLGTYKSTSNTSTRTIHYGHSGSVAVSVEDSAAAAMGDSASFGITGSEIVPPLTLSAGLSQETVIAGHALTAAAIASGGHPPYTYSFVWQVVDNGIAYYAGGDSGAENEHTQTIRFGQDGAVIVIVSDKYGRRAQCDPLLFTITKSTAVPPFLAEAILGASTVQAGQEMSVSIQVTGGQQPCEYTFLWVIEEFGVEQDLAADRGTSNQSTQVIPFGRSGYISWTATDSADRTISGESPAFAITGGTVSQPLTLQAILAKDNVPMGGTVKVAFQPSGGLPPYSYSCLYFLELEDGSTLVDQIDSSLSEIEWPVKGGQRGVIIPLLFDSVGRITQGNGLTFSVLENISLLPGDANGDSILDILDLVSIIDYIVSSTQPASFTNADANGDKTVDFRDLVWVIDKIVGG